MKLRMTNDEWRRQPKRTAFRSAATSSFEIRPSQCTRAFTLIELILVMALIVIAVSLIAPHFSSFFRGRALDSEMHQLLALMHDGQSRAVSEGVPMLLWIDEKKSAYGLEEEPGFADKDPQAEEFTLNPDLQIQIVNTGPTIAPAPAVSTPAANSEHAGLPQIRFLPDGTIAETSPKIIRLSSSDGSAVTLTQSRDRDLYEPQSDTNQPGYAGG